MTRGYIKEAALIDDNRMIVEESFPCTRMIRGLMDPGGANYRPEPGRILVRREITDPDEIAAIIASFGEKTP